MQFQDELARLHYQQKKFFTHQISCQRKFCSGAYQTRLLTKLLTEELVVYSVTHFLSLLKIKQPSLVTSARTTAPSSFTTTDVTVS